MRLAIETNQEALKLLKPYRDCLIDQHGCPISDLVFALDVAIKALEQDKIIHCKDCKFIRRLGYEGYNYCALEDRPNRNWSVDETDFCSWAERRE